MIEIYNVTIDQNEIIGVGPFMIKRTADPVVAQLYNDRTYYFTVYTKKYHFIVSTDLLSFTTEFAESSKSERGAILQAHKALRNCLISGSFTELSVTSDPNY